ncbi:hypothetical protein B7494_g916 [Chlorociboria aeruginascens]|nr:hypothetical protein B7494_g916 [Chlorociboria aeruginascens]
MSDVQKPVDEPVAAPAAAETPAPVVEESKPEEAAPAAEAPAVAEPTTESAAVPEPETKDIEEGVLGYKGPGLLKGLIFQKKFFYFGSEPTETKHLSNYLRGEKPEVGNHNAAWASYTGKGLLYFTKKASEKSTPAGIINLSDASEISEDGAVDFFFTAAGHKHTFQASSPAERTSWVATLKAKIEEAKELATSVPESEEYKKSHSALSKPVVAAASTPKKSTEVKKEEKTEAKEEKKDEEAVAKEEKAEAKEEKKTRNSRSASRKRTSIFGAIPGFGKKEEKVEAKEEAAPATTEEPTAATTAEATPAPVEAPAEAVVAPAADEAAPSESRPAPAKRNSIFDTLKSQFSHKDKKPEAEAAPVVPAKDDTVETVAESAPIIPAVETSEPLATSVASPATVPTESTTIGTESKVEAPAATKTDKRKSSLPWLSKKEKATSDEEGEKPKSPFAKFRATVKGKSSPKADKPAAEEKAVEPEAKAEETPAVEAPATAEPISEPVPAVLPSTPQVSATA